MKGVGEENRDPAPVVPPRPAPPVKKDRHIVTWTPQEDDLLREHIALHGTDNWTSIAALFKDKTSRQCRRRWYTYLNSECKKGGWSAEEDMLLCEAQKIFGNRWTEIAKVVSGRTDNAVKNRFSTLCKKRAKIEASSKENKIPSYDPSNKRILVQNVSTTGELSTSNKQMSITHPKEITVTRKRILGKHEPKQNQNQTRSPLTMLAQNLDTVSGLSNNTKGPLYDATNKVSQATFLRRDDPKLIALLQQAELLTSLSKKVNSENTNQSLDEAWKALQDYLIQTEDSGLLKQKFSGMDSMLDELRDLIEDLHNSKGEGQQPLRQIDFNEDSQGSSECITVSACNVHSEQIRSNGQFEDRSPQKNNVEDSSPQKYDELNYLNDDAACSSLNASPEAMLPLSGMSMDKVANVGTSAEFASPLQTIPPFQSFSDEFPTPVFTSSERHFLLSLLDLSYPETNTNPSKLPSCKRSLLDIYKPS